MNLWMSEWASRRNCHVQKKSLTWSICPARWKSGSCNRKMTRNQPEVPGISILNSQFDVNDIRQHHRVDVLSTWRDSQVRSRNDRLNLLHLLHLLRFLLLLRPASFMAAKSVFIAFLPIQVDIIGHRQRWQQVSSRIPEFRNSPHPRNRNGLRRSVVIYDLNIDFEYLMTDRWLKRPLDRNQLDNDTRMQIAIKIEVINQNQVSSTVLMMKLTRRQINQLY